MRLDPALHYLIVCLLTLVFVQGGISKLLARDEFQGIVTNYRLLPAALVASFALALPLAELTAGIGVLLVPTRPHAALLAVGLLVMFSTAMAINLARGRTEIDCGCFKSALRQTISGWLILRNVLLILAGTALWLPLAERAIGLLDFVSVAAGSLMLFLGYFAVGILTRRPITRYDAGFASGASIKRTWKTL